MTRLQFPSVGRSDTCDLCHYNTVYYVCEHCRAALTGANRAVVHGLDPDVGAVHVDVCTSCVAGMKARGEV